MHDEEEDQSRVAPLDAGSVGRDLPRRGQTGDAITAERMNKYLHEPHRGEVIAWLLSRGFIFDETRGVMAIAWSKRSGMDSTDLEFYPLARYANDVGWDAIVGQHASGQNPRLDIGRCETLADVQMVYDTIRRINGYKEPEPERGPS